MKIILTALFFLSTIGLCLGDIQVGDKICVEGFIMDFFCINRGTLLDNPSVQTLLEPERHSVHCLVDVGSCVRSPFEVLIGPFPNQTLYARGFRLDDSSKDDMVALARQTGSSARGCTTCDDVGSLRTGFRAVMTAEVTSLNADSDVPPEISVIDAQPSHDLEDACVAIYNMTDIIVALQDSNSTIVDPSGSTGKRTPLQRQHLIHGSLMLIGWGFLLPSGTLFARFFKHRPNGLWFNIHRACQTFGLFLAVIGWIIALRNFQVFADKGYNNYRHGVLGCVTMGLGLLQPINAILRPHPPSEGEEAGVGRKIWEAVHKTLGYGAIVLAAITIVLGTTVLPDVGDQRTFQVAYGVTVFILVLLVVNLNKDKSKYVDVRANTQTGSKDTLEEMEQCPPQ